MKYRFWLGLAIFLLFPASGVWAQLSVSGRPASFTRTTKASVQAVKMPAIDRAALLAEDAREESKDVPFRFGIAFDVDYNLNNSGTWEELDDGSRLWRLKLTCPGAFSINIIYDRFWLPEGAKFYVYSEDRSHVLGAFTSLNNKEHEKFATAPVKGDVCILEYHELARTNRPGEISLESVIHGYKNLFNFDVVKDAIDFDVVKDAVEFGESGACNNNVNCPVGQPWQNEKRAVAMILTGGGQRICSGAMINNVRQDLTPYFLTANHCLGGEETWIFMFNYESPSCTNIDGPTYMTTSGSVLRAAYDYSDFALLELSETPPDSFNIFYAGWSIENIAADSSVCIHHPSGDIKKITFDYDSLTTSKYAGPTGSGDSHWRIGQWEDGTTEGGSSGSPLFDKNHRIIGQLHGGFASCESLSEDWFGKLSISWNYGGSPDLRLRDWLDPDGTGQLILNGRFPSGLLIIVTPYEDTKDSLNDFEINCEIISQSALVPDSLLLRYQIDGLWDLDVLEIDGDPTHFRGYIPAQSPGTIINYYIYARNIEDEYDSS
ncbi:MAG: trypsin-like peptidase domain-containing protein, partial [candidate division Zixibacteria bacterium]|nr:trypsin-like peptidase domain-containing protein [candidate division Zixibacteria bacterium]